MQRAFLCCAGAYIRPASMTRARVLLLTAALGPLDYRVPQGSDAPPGSVVVAPPGPRRMGGVVWEDASFRAPDPAGDNRLRNPYEIVSVPPVPAPPPRPGDRSQEPRAGKDRVNTVSTRAAR